MGEKISTRVAYGNALGEFGENPLMVALDADLASCTMSEVFAQKYPDRFFNVGIAEANMIDMAAGFATTGKIAFCHSFAMFTAGRGYDQIRNSVAYPHLNVKIIGSHAGLTVGEDGATHQCIEDLSLMRTVPGMVVLAPCDAHETREAVKAIIDYEGPCFMRTGRIAVDTVTDAIPGYSFTLGKGVTLRDGGDLTIVATGLMVQKALGAADLLEKEGIHPRVIDIHTIKPLDKDLILKAAAETGVLVTAEEHSVVGGLGSAVCELVCAEYPVPVIRVGVNDEFGRSGPAEELLTRYGLSSEHLVETAKKAVSRKK
ncbi:MAG: transketolase family protein [Spirochaetaceae bacterium]|jgi:transketolase|nr:transketolase family protein [Spirochaetaceae bacterium]